MSKDSGFMCLHRCIHKAAIHVLLIVVGPFHEESSALEQQTELRISKS